MKPKIGELHRHLPFDSGGPHSFDPSGLKSAETFWSEIAEALSVRVSGQSGYHFASKVIRRHGLSELEPFAKAVANADGTADFSITDCRIGYKAWAREKFSSAEIKGVRSVFAEGAGSNPMEVRFFKDDGTYVLWTYEAWFDNSFNVRSSVSLPKKKKSVPKVEF